MECSKYIAKKSDGNKHKPEIFGIRKLYDSAGFCTMVTAPRVISCLVPSSPRYSTAGIVVIASFFLDCYLDDAPLDDASFPLLVLYYIVLSFSQISAS